MKKSKAQAIIRQTRRFYNAVAKEWNISRNTPSKVKIKAVRGIKQGMKVLDLGCGNGFVAAPIIARGARYFGVDISSRLISIAKKKNVGAIKNKKASFAVANALKLPFKNNFFDYAVSFAVFHHIPSAELRLKFLQELYRVMKPGAVAKIDNWNLLQEWGRERFEIKTQLKNIPAEFDEGDVLVPWKATGGKTISRYIHIFSDKELRHLARLAGFKKIKIEYFNRAGIKTIKTKNGEAQILTVKK